MNEQAYVYAFEHMCIHFVACAHAMRMRESVNYEIDHDRNVDTINQQMIMIANVTTCTIATRAGSVPDGFACIGRRNN
jgi:hypothetical protein